MHVGHQQHCGLPAAGTVRAVLGELQRPEIEDVEGGTQVALNMQGLPESGVEHINHIHAGGTCADDRAGRTAPVTIPLNNIVAEEAGTGSATTKIKDGQRIR